MSMFGWLKKKSEKENLEAEYRKLMEASYRLSHTDRRASDARRVEADEVLKKIESLSEN